jgi:TolB-like protein
MALSLPDKPSIAVLPFVNMSGDPKQEFFSDGITEDIITALSKMPMLFVIARNSTFTYKGKPVKVKQISEEPGVQYVPEGSVQRSANRVRITAQLIDALSGHHIWAEGEGRRFPLRLLTPEWSGNFGGNYTRRSNRSNLRKPLEEDDREAVFGKTGRTV